MSTAKSKKRKLSLVQRIGGTLLAHPVAACLLSGLFVVAVAVFIFWFTLFSGLDASADFVYSQF